GRGAAPDRGLGRRVAGVRRLTALAVGAAAPADVLHRAASHVARAAEALAPHGAGSRRTTRQPGAADPAAVMPFDPVIGPLSPLAPPLRGRWEPPTAIGEGCFTAAAPGP